MPLDDLSKPPPNQPGLRTYWAGLDPNVKASIWADYHQEAIDVSNNEKLSLTEPDSEIYLDVGKDMKDRKRRSVYINRDVEYVGSKWSHDADLGLRE